MTHFLVTVSIVVLSLILWKWPGTHRAQLLAIFMIGSSGGLLLGTDIGQTLTLLRTPTLDLMRSATLRVLNDRPHPEPSDPPHYYADKLTYDAMLAEDVGALVRVLDKALETREVDR